MAVSPKGARRGQDDSSSTVKAFSDNRRAVEEEIGAILKEVCANEVSEELTSSVTHIVEVASELALEFGSQRALLGLAGLRSGDEIEIGQGFIDCEDGDSTRGALETVDLVVSPRLFRIGDGRNDLKTEKIIVPGEIYPKRG